MKEKTINVSNFIYGMSNHSLEDARYFIYRGTDLKPVAVVDFYNDINFRVEVTRIDTIDHRKSQSKLVKTIAELERK